MDCSFFASSRSTRVSIISVTTLLFTLLGVASAQVNSAEVTALKFAQHELPVGKAAYDNGAGTAIVTGDFNNDGILDVVTVVQTPSQWELAFFAGLAGGGFSSTPVISVINSTIGQGPAPAFSADFNRDGKLDLAIASGQAKGPVTIMLGNGNGTFKPGKSITVRTATGVANASAIALADFNGDHVPDIAVSDGISQYTWIYLGNGNGTFTLADTQKFGGNSLVAGDFNADGNQDVAFASGAGAGGDNVGMFLGNGNGTVHGPIITTITGGSGSVSGTTGLAVGDFYNNRIQSLAVLYSSGQPDGNGITYLVTVQYSDNGQLVQGPLNQVTQPVAEGPTYIYGGDLNGDFIDDVFIAGGGYYESPLTQYMLGKGDGTFLPPQNTPYDTQGTSFIYPVIRDLNLDSRHDIAMAWSNVEDDNGGGDVLINDNATQNCNPPRANALAVNICAPKSGAVIPATYTFKGSGNAFNGIAKRMELWIDGVKIGQNLEDQLNVTTSLITGAHTASFVVVDSFDNYTSKSVTFTTK